MSINNETKQIQMAAYIKLLEIYKAAGTNNAEKAQEQFQELPATIREHIFELVGQLAQSSASTDCQWDQTRIFEKLPHLQTAIKTVAFNAFDSLAQKDKEYVANRVQWHYNPSIRSTDPNWGKTHAKDPDQVENLLLGLTENTHAFSKHLAVDLEALRRAKLLTPENWRLAITHDSLVGATVTLQQANLLTPENWKALIAHPRPRALASALSTLRATHLITAYRQIAIAHANPDTLALALNGLQRTNLLTPENRQVVITHPHPGAAAHGLMALQEAHLLTPENRQFISTHADLLYSVDLLRNLLDAHLLTQENFDAFMLRPILYTSEIRNGVWNRLPTHLLTQQVLQQIFTLSAGQNPIAHLTAYVDQLLNGPVAAQPALNGTQSTHTTTVHASVSESAMKLMSKYKIKDLDETIGQLSAAINALPPNPRNEAAKRCLIRLTALGYTYVDPASGVSTKRLLALAYLANQEAKTDLQLLIDGLYECQRGYNLNANGEDTNPADPDLPICVAGTFNKIMEKLNGLDDAVSIVFITKGTAALKLQAAVRDYALKNNITDITDQNWPEIRNGIKDEMAPYRVAFASDAAFETFIDAGMYVDLTTTNA